MTAESCASKTSSASGSESILERLAGFAEKLGTVRKRRAFTRRRLACDNDFSLAVLPNHYATTQKGNSMLLDSLGSQVGVAVLGGVAAEMLHWYGLARKPGALAKYRAKAVYWITTIGMILLGGAMPLLYIQGSASALLCFHLGAATPIILQKLLS